MGYESKIYVISPFSSYDENGKQYCEIIATFNLCVVGNRFYNLFKEPSKFTLHENGVTIDKDCYGSELKMAKASDVLVAMAEDEEAMNYRRTRTFYEFLKASIDKYDDLYLIHFGY